MIGRHHAFNTKNMGSSRQKEGAFSCAEKDLISGISSSRARRRPARVQGEEGQSGKRQREGDESLLEKGWGGTGGRCRGTESIPGNSVRSLSSSVGGMPAYELLGICLQLFLEQSRRSRRNGKRKGTRAVVAWREGCWFGGTKGPRTSRRFFFWGM